MATFVLVHGSYQGGWIWQRVAKRLRASGHDVHAPTLDGCAERRHQVRPGIDATSQGEELAELLFFEDLHEVVLVGTSLGGMVACRAAELSRDRIDRLVFVDALALFNGERIRDIVTRSLPYRRPHRGSIPGGCGTAPVRRPGTGNTFLGARPLYPASDGVSDTPVKLDSFWVSNGQRRSSGVVARKSWRTPSATHGRTPQRKMV